MNRALRLLTFMLAANQLATLVCYCPTLSPANGARSPVFDACRLRALLWSRRR